MIKGLLGGVLSGGLVSAALLGAVSLMSAPPAPRSAGAAPIAAPAEAPQPEAIPAVPGAADMAPTVEDAGTSTAAPATADATPAPDQPAVTQPAGTSAPAESAPVAEAITPPAGSEFDKPAVDAPAVAPAADAQVATAPAPSVAVPDAAEPAAPAPASASAPQPSQSQAAEVLATAPDAEAAPVPPATIEAPAAVEPAPAPVAVPPAADRVPAPPFTADTPAAPAAPAEEALPDPAQDAPVTDEVLEESLPDDPAGGIPMPEETPPPAGATTTPATVPTAVGKRVLPPVRKAGASEAAPDTGQAQTESPSDLPPVISPEAPLAPKGVTTAPKPGFDRAVPGVRVLRLPSSESGTPAAEAAPAAPAAEAAPLPATPNPATPNPATAGTEVDRPETPMDRNAAVFDNPQKLPVLAVIVIDVGDRRGGADLAQLLSLPSPVTVAFNPMRKDTLEAAARSRARGFEVAILADGLPKEGTASDVEVAYQSISAAMPEAVAVMTSPESTLLARRPVAQQMVAILKDEGLGLVTYARGLSPARELARGQGLPQAEVTRVADEPRGDVATILRALESEAFQAQQKGFGVVVLRSYPDSMTALSQFMAKAKAPESGLGVKVGPVTALFR